jgi:hypothetical protein
MAKTVSSLPHEVFCKENLENLLFWNVGLREDWRFQPIENLSKPPPFMGVPKAYNSGNFGTYIKRKSAYGY